MASTGALADFAKKPPKYKAAVFALIAVALFGVYWQLVYSKLRKDMAAEEDTADALASEEAKVKRDEKEFAELKAKQDVLQSIIQENDSALPTAAQLPAFFDMLNRKVGEANVEVRSWDQQPEVQVDETIYKVPVRIEVQGTFYEIKKFFYLLFKMNQKAGDDTAPAAPGTLAPADVEERDRILTIEDLVIDKPEVKNGELVLSATFTASTFRKEEPPAPAADAAGKPGSKPGTPAKPPAKPPGTAPAAGSAAPTGGATPPPGTSAPTGAPAQVGAKVDAAMDKDDARARSGPGTAEAGAASTGADRVKGGI